MPDEVFPAVERIVDSPEGVYKLADEFRTQIKAAYDARREHGIVVRWSFEGRELEESGGGVW